MSIVWNGIYSDTIKIVFFLGITILQSGLLHSTFTLAFTIRPNGNLQFTHPSQGEFPRNDASVATVKDYNKSRQKLYSHETLNENPGIDNHIQKRHIKKGDKFPRCQFTVIDESSDGNSGVWKKLISDDVFEHGRRVVLFGLPGAFTPTCSSKHLPEFEKLFDEIQSHGIDDIYCLSVNDPYVISAWRRNLNIKKVKLIPDGLCKLTDMIGFGVQKDNIEFGRRSWRFSMIVNDNVVEELFVENGMGDNSEGDPFKVSDAGTLLNYLKSKPN